MGSPAEDVDRYIELALRRGATDLLLSHGAPPMIRLRGELIPLYERPALHGQDVGQLIDALLGPEQQEAFAVEREIDFSFGWREEARLRGNAFVQRSMPALALRVIPDTVPSLEELGVPAAVRDLMTLPQGLILVTGPTGSGKSTTQAALVDWVNTHRSCHILTLEDPIEYVHEHKRSLVSQREIGVDSASFAQALRAALREDPDVLLVGEMRDPESISITLTLAETGHLVLSTLHTNDTAQALDRIIDVFPAERQAQVRVQLAGSLVAVVAQRLVPHLGGGMIAAFEVLMATHAVRNLVREGKSRQLRNAVTMGAADGMRTLEQSLSELVRDGRVSYDDAVARSMYPAEVAAPNGHAKTARTLA